MARIVLDLRMVRGRLHGIARYALELARELPALAPQHTFVALTPPEGLGDCPTALRPDLELVPAKAGFLSPLEQLDLPLSLWRAGTQLFHATSFSVPLAWPGRWVATLHDANHLALGENYDWRRGLYYRAVVGPALTRARALLTVSAFSRAELARYLPVPEARWEVIHQGVSAELRRADPAQIAAFRARYGLPPRYFAAVGNAKAHKNLGVVARAAARLPAPVALLAGEGARLAWGFPESSLELPALADADLAAFLSGANALLFPSRYEGFGLPPVEAMACGTPVVTSRASSLPEVCGDAAVWADPDDPDSWVHAVHSLEADGPGRAALVERGLARAQALSWRTCAQRTLAVYQRALA